MIKPDAKIRMLVMLLSLIGVIAVAVGGYLYYSTLTRTSIEWAHYEAAQHLEKIGAHIESYLTWSHYSAGALSGLKELKQALAGKDPAALAQANDILDHFKATLNTDVCYLIDLSGTVIASSNRHAPDSFVGASYAFRPYFQKAIEGNPAIYMALGATSKKRGIYFSHPVYAKGKGEPSGVAVIKASIEPIENDFMKPLDGILLFADPHGVIFVSSRPEWLFHLLLEAAPETLTDIARTKQFGIGPWDWTGVRLSDENHAGDPSGNTYRVHRYEIVNYHGWQLIYLHNEAVVSERVTASLRKTVGFMALTTCLFFGFVIFLLFSNAKKEIIQRKKAEEHRDRLISDLQKALTEVKTLSGLLPICSHCKNIRDDKGYWRQIESYIHAHSDANFTHGICPNCAKKFYPEFDLYGEKEDDHN